MPDAPPPHDDDAEADVVVLRVPADGRYARVVRIAVSAFAVRLGLAPARVEDLRLAVDEALVLLLGRRPARPEPGTGTGAGTGAQAADPDGTVDPSVEVRLDAPGGRAPVELALRLVPAATDGPEDRSALARFTELIPPGVLVVGVDADAGVVELRLPG